MAHKRFNRGDRFRAAAIAARDVKMRRQIDNASTLQIDIVKGRLLGRDQSGHPADNGAWGFF